MLESGITQPHQTLYGGAHLFRPDSLPKLGQVALRFLRSHGRWEPELQRRLEGTGVTSNAVCPGYVPATLVDYQPTRRGRFMFRYILPLMPFSRSIEQATDNYIYAALDPSLEGVGGKFIVDRRFKRSSDQSYEEADARRLWEMSEKWAGLTSDSDSLSGVGRQT